MQGARLCTWLVTRLKSETFGKLLITKLRSLNLYGRDSHSNFEPVIRAYFKLILYLLVALFEKLKYFKSKVLVLSFFQTSLTVIRLSILRVLFCRGVVNSTPSSYFKKNLSKYQYNLIQMWNILFKNFVITRKCQNKNSKSMKIDGNS